jgi:hypothetical protein
MTSTTAVDDDDQVRGIGTVLVEELATKARRRGVRTVVGMVLGAKSAVCRPVTGRPRHWGPKVSPDRFTTGDMVPRSLVGEDTLTQPGCDDGTVECPPHPGGERRTGVRLSVDEVHGLRRCRHLLQPAEKLIGVGMDRELVIRHDLGADSHVLAHDLDFSGTLQEVAPPRADGWLASQDH